MKAESELPEFKQVIVANGLALLRGASLLILKLMTLISLNITRKMSRIRNGYFRFWMRLEVRQEEAA